MKRLRIRHDYVDAIATEIAGLALGALVPAIAARRFGPAGFGMYTVYFEIIAISQPVLLLGLGVAVPRYVASQRSLPAPAHTTYEVMATGIAIGIAATLPVGVLIAVLAGEWSRWLFGASSGLVGGLALAIPIAASVIWSVVSTTMRGSGLMGRANLLMFTYVGASPLFAIAVASTVHQFFAVLGLCWILTAILIGTAWKLRLPRRDVALQLAGKLLNFGLRRIPGELALFGLFSVPTLVAANRLGAEKAGYFGFAISVVTIASSAFAPVSAVLLPKVSESYAQGQLHAIRSHVRVLVPIAFLSSLAVTAAVEVAAPIGVRLYLGDEFSASVSYVRIIALALPGYVLFIATRSVLDAAHHKPVSLRWAIAGLVVFAVVSAWTRTSGVGLAAGFAIAVSTLGVGSSLSTWRVLRDPAKPPSVVAA